jgi:murein hydrolase activator
MQWRSTIFLCLFLPMAAQAEAPQNLKQTQAQLVQTRAKAENLARELRSAESDMQTLRLDVTSVARDIQKSEAVVSQSERTLAQLSQQVAEGEKRLSARESSMQNAMLAMLQIERLPAAALFAQPNKAQDMVRTAAALDTARSALESEAALLKKELATLKEKQTALAAAKEQYRKNAAALNAKRATLTTQLSKRAKLQSTLSQNYQSAEADARRLAREAASLQQLITGLNQQPRSVPASAIPARGAPTTPVTGNIIHRYGEKKGASDTWRGMMLRTRPSALVVAPSGGEVAFTGPFMNYGSMVLLRHQGNAMSLLAGFGRIDVKLKQAVKAGEPLGVMAATGQQNLYVELRENAKPIDPARWFATVSSSLGR